MDLNVCSVYVGYLRIVIVCTETGTFFFEILSMRFRYSIKKVFINKGQNPVGIVFVHGLMVPIQCGM